MVTMVMDKVSSVVLRYPWITIAVIALITIGAVLEITLNPMEESFQQEDFLPDMEVASAWNDYEEIFTSDYAFSGLIKDPDGDLITVEDFKTIVNLTQRIKESDTFQEWKEENVNTDNPSAPPISLHTMRSVVDSAEGIVRTGDQSSDLLQPVMVINGTASYLNGNVEAGNYSYTDEIAGMLQNLTEAIGGYTKTASDDFGEPVETPDIEGYYDSFDSDQELKDEVGYLLSYNVTSDAVTNGSRDCLILAGSVRKVLTTLKTTNSLLDSLLDDEEFGELKNGSLKQMAQGLVTDMDEVERDLETKSSIANRVGDPVQIPRLAQSFYSSSFSFNMFLTKDLDPSTGVIEAEGSLYMVSLNYTLNYMVDNDQEKLLDIEGELIDIFEEVDEGSDLDISALGSQTISQEIMDASNESMRILLPLAFLMVIVILSIIYRNILDVLMNLFSLMLAIVWMYGFGSLLGFSSNPMITAVPVLLVGLNINYSIQIGRAHV